MRRNDEKLEEKKKGKEKERGETSCKRIKRKKKDKGEKCTSKIL